MNDIWKQFLRPPHGKGKHYVQPKGYAALPGGGPTGETCGSCRFLARFPKYFKCKLVRDRWTGGRGSDILFRSPACSKWERRDG